MGTQKMRKLDGYAVEVDADVPDVRDWLYQPALVQLAASRSPPAGLDILDQYSEGACTGFALAAVINLLKAQRGEPGPVSPRMLYEMARLHDEWGGEDYSGSSCRGAIKGWFHMGVCSAADWPYRDGRPGKLTLWRARGAREVTLGAYYRIEHRISDFHAALNEVDAIFVSANVHDGWRKRSVKKGAIPMRDTVTGGHAFAIVGYDDRGFWVQNSWGSGWGQGGLALWSYEDWQSNIRDAWVLRLALSTPQIWHKPTVRSKAETDSPAQARSPNRGEIAGHFVHLDDGHYHRRGKYWSTPDDVTITANHLAKSDWYRHLLIYAHGGLNSPDDSACRISALKDVFMDNRIYPYHVMYDTGLLEELGDVIRGKRDAVKARVGGASDFTDRVLEMLARVPGRALWREMKQGAQSPFASRGDGTDVLKRFIRELRKQGSGLTIHLAGHSTGGILLARLLERWHKTPGAPSIDTITLLAPAATIELFDACYRPQLGRVRLTQIVNLSDRLERDDTVGGVYRKSLLYLVSRAFEDERKTPLLGLQRNSKALASHPRLKLIYSKGPAGAERRSRAKSHGAFDNDVATMNHLLETILKAKPTRPFRDSDLDY